MDFSLLRQTQGKYIGKHISKNLSSRYSQKPLDHTKQSATDTFKSTSKYHLKNSRSNY